MTYLSIYLSICMSLCLWSPLSQARQGLADAEAALQSRAQAANEHREAALD